MPPALSSAQSPYSALDRLLRPVQNGCLRNGGLLLHLIQMLYNGLMVKRPNDARIFAETKEMTDHPICRTVFALAHRLILA